MLLGVLYLLVFLALVFGIVSLVVPWGSLSVSVTTDGTSLDIAGAKYKVSGLPFIVLIASVVGLSVATLSLLANRYLIMTQVGLLMGIVAGIMSFSVYVHAYKDTNISASYSDTTGAVSMTNSPFVAGFALNVVSAIFALCAFAVSVYMSGFTRQLKMVMIAVTVIAIITTVLIVIGGSAKPVPNATIQQ